MAETTTITKPAPIIEGALTSFLETIKELDRDWETDRYI